MTRTMNLMLKMNFSLMFAAAAKLRRLFAAVHQRYKEYPLSPLTKLQSNPGTHNLKSTREAQRRENAEGLVEMSRRTFAPIARIQAINSHKAAAKATFDEAGLEPVLYLCNCDSSCDSSCNCDSSCSCDSSLVSCPTSKPCTTY